MNDPVKTLLLVVGLLAAVCILALCSGCAGTTITISADKEGRLYIEGAGVICPDK